MFKLKKPLNTAGGISIKHSTLEFEAQKKYICNFTSIYLANNSKNLCLCLEIFEDFWQ